MTRSVQNVKSPALTIESAKTITKISYIFAPPMTSQAAIVTGAAGGIGLAYTKRLLERGYRVILADLNSNRGAELQQELGPKTLFVQCDVADWSSQAALFKAAHDWAGGAIDVFIANAGTEEPEPFYDLPDDGGEPVPPNMKILDVNLNSVIYGLRLFRHYRKKAAAVGGTAGKMIVTNSMAGIYRFPVAPIYSATKHAVSRVPTLDLEAFSRLNYVANETGCWTSPVLVSEAS